MVQAGERLLRQAADVVRDLGGDCLCGVIYCNLGSGSVDYAGFFRALAQVGYTGTITFESFSSTVVSPVLSNMLAIWRNLWEDSGDLARHARSFIDDQLRAVASIGHH